MGNLGNKFKGAVAKGKFFVKDFFDHWNTPPKKDYFISNKEFVCYSVGGMGVQGMGILTQYLTIVQGVYLAAAYNFDAWIIQYTGWIMAILALVRAPIVGAIIDNTNTKYGRFRPHLLWAGFASVVVFSLLAFLPGMFLGIENKKTAQWLAIMTYQLLFFIAMTTYQFFSYGRVGLAQVITPNTQERTKLYSIGGIVDSLGPSIVQLFFPILARAVDKENGLNGQLAFQVLIPIFGVLCAGVALIMFFGTKERLVLQKEKKLRIKFFQGIKKSFHNKYFWLFNLSNIGGFARLSMFGSSIYIARFLIGGATGDNVYGLMSTVLGLAFIPGMALSPLIIKKIGKKKMTILSFIGSGIICGVMLVLILTCYGLKFLPWILYVCLFAHNVFAALWTVTSPAMTADYCDYQQWKTGDRLDGFMSNFTSVITTVAGMGTSALVTWLLVRAGAAESNDYADPVVLKKVFVIWGVLGIVCAILAIIPFLFWDLTEEKHHEMMTEVKSRALVADIEGGTLEQYDVAAAIAMGLATREQVIAMGLDPDATESDAAGGGEPVPLPETAQDGSISEAEDGSMLLSDNESRDETDEFTER